MATIERHSPGGAATGRLAVLARRLGVDEPHPLRGPFTRWPRTADAVLAALVFAMAVTSVALSALEPGETFTLESLTGLPPVAYLLLAVAAVALWWRRSRPVAVVTAVLLVVLGWSIAGYGDGADLNLIVAVYSAGRYCSRRLVSLTVVAAAAAASVLGSVIDGGQRIDVWPAFVLTLLPWYVGVRVRDRGAYLGLLRERAERRESEQLARARAAVADERAQIARELHDVVAHQVSMMTVQAGAAKTVARDDLDAAVEAMGDVERAGRQALGELRHLLGVLRPDTDEGPGELGPQPGLDDVPALAARLRSTGAVVTVTLDELPDLPAVLDLSAFRIVQESVTNVVKHAGARPQVDIAVTLDGGVVDIDVANTVGAGGVLAQLPVSGFGIAGMRERASLLGGSLTAGARSPQRFGIHARLPLEREPR